VLSGRWDGRAVEVVQFPALLSDPLSLCALTWGEPHEIFSMGGNAGKGVKRNSGAPGAPGGKPLYITTATLLYCIDALHCWNTDILR
jgi:hypothetical protein